MQKLRFCGAELRVPGCTRKKQNNLFFKMIFVIQMDKHKQIGTLGELGLNVTM